MDEEGREGVERTERWGGEIREKVVGRAERRDRKSRETWFGKAERQDWEEKANKGGGSRETR